MIDGLVPPEPRMTQPSTVRPDMPGMACVDTGGNTRIPVLMQMVGAVDKRNKNKDKS